MLRRILEILEQLPAYMGEAIISLISVIIASLVLGYLSSKYFSRIAEVTKVEGLLFEKKIPIYKEIFSRVEQMNQLHLLRDNITQSVINFAQKSGFEISKEKNNPIASIFLDHKKMKKTILELDNYISIHRLYYDDEVYKQLLLYQNYIIVFNQLYHNYYREVTAYQKDKKIIKNNARLLFIILGLILQEDFMKQNHELLNCIRKSFNKITLKRRKQPRYDYAFYNNEDDYVMSHIKRTMLFKEREKINKLLLLFVKSTVHNY